MKLEVRHIVSDPAGAQQVTAEVVRAALGIVATRLAAAGAGDAQVSVDALDVVMPVPVEELRSASDRARAARLLAMRLLQALDRKLGTTTAMKVAQARGLQPGSQAALRALWRFKEDEVTADNAEQLLELVHRLDTQKRIYTLRQRTVHKCWKISTPRAYTDASLPKEKAAMKTHLKKPESWCPRRTAIHEKIMREELAKADAVARRMLGPAGTNKPTVLMMRGNSGSGKTYTLQNSDHQAIRGLNVTDPATKGDPEGLLNPDDIKYRLSKEFEGSVATSSQVHPEGSMLTEKMIDVLFQQKKSMVLDKRFGQAKEVQDEVCAEAKKHGYRIVMIDLDAQLDTSCKRVAKRELKGKAPNVEFKAVAHGFQEIRSERAQIRKLAEMGQLDAYFLFKSDGPKAGTLIAEKSDDGTFKVHDQALWEEALAAGQAEIMQASDKWAKYMDVKATGVDPEKTPAGLKLPE